VILISNGRKVVDAPLASSPRRAELDELFARKTARDVDESVVAI
jgi:hypothetical protein